MAEEQIDKLLIEIEASVNGAKKVDDLKKKLNELEDSAKKAEKSISGLSWGKSVVPDWAKDIQPKKTSQKSGVKASVALSDYSKKIEEAKDSLEKLDTQTKKTVKSTSKLADAFVRIVRFKIVASVLQKTINAAKEGVEALAEYDDQFKDTLNSYQASFKQIGGGSALVLSPILGGLEGMVGLLSDGVGALTNTVSALMAGLSGKTSYTAVKTFKEIKEEIAAADKKAKDLRHTISGFDELNIFSNKNQSETIDIFTTKEIGSMDYAMDVAGMAALAGAAGIVGKAIQALTEKFSKKNKTLEEQTEDTKEDAKQTSKLGDVINSLVPKAGGAVAALGALGALVLTPLLKKEGVTVPAAEAEAALDALGESNPAPVIETSALDASMETVKSTISDGMSSVVTTFDTKFSEINEKFTTLLSDLTAKWQAFLSGFSGGGIKLSMGDVTGGLINGRFRDINPNLKFDLSPWTSGATTSTTEQATTTEDKILKFVESEESKKKTQIYGGGAALAAALLFGAIGSKALGGIGGGLGGKKFAGAHANGGIVSSGEFFMARENGMPEFVGSFGSRTGVANNEQIVSGIAGGVESALSAYVPQIIRAIENNAAVVNIGDDQIARSAQRGAARYQRITGQPMFS